MITDDMRILPGVSRGAEIAQAYLHAIEADDFGALKSLLALNVTLRHANYPAVEGRDEALGMIFGYRRIVARLEFQIANLIGSDDSLVIEKLNVATLTEGRRVRIPAATFLDFDDGGLIVSIRIYADVADLFRKFNAPGAEALVGPLA